MGNKATPLPQKKYKFQKFILNFNKNFYDGSSYKNVLFMLSVFALV